jgi:predicted transcriptional regulator
MAAVADKRSLIAKIAANYVRRNFLSVAQIGALISSVADALEQAKKIAGTAVSSTSVQGAQQPAVPIKKSVQRDYIVCLEDGKHTRTLKRHLRTAHGMTPQQYREKWRLPRDYPITAPAYSERRSQLAKWVGLGQKGGAATSDKVKRRSKNGRRTAASATAP